MGAQDQTDIERVERDLDALLDLSESLISTSEIQGALLRITERMAKTLGSDRCSIILLGARPEDGFVVATSDDPALTNLRIPVDVYPEIREVIRTGEPLVINDVRHNSLFDEVRDKIKDKPVGSTIIFPVRMARNVRGVLLLRTRERRETELTKRETRFGRIVANATAIALRNARLYEAIRDHSERRLSERLKAERRLRQIEKYQRFFDYAGDGLIIIDGSGRILYANHAAQSILGFEDPAISQIRLHDVVEPSGREALDDLMEAVKEHRYQSDVDLPILRASGEVAVLSLTTAALEESSQTGDLPPIDKREDPSAKSASSDVPAIVSFRDVTETRAMEEELRRTKDFLANVIDSSADAIVAADMKGQILIFNEIAERITGFSQDEILGMHVSKLYPPGVATEIMRELRSDQNGRQGKVQERRQNLRTKAGELVPVNLAAAIVYDQGEEVATVGIFSDLRERLHMEDQLQKAQRKLELSATQSAVVELAGAAAHELNQPLTTIIGSVELLQRKTTESKVVESLKMILSEADRMAEIVRKLGQLTRYQTKPYLGKTEILDLEASIEKEE